MSDRYIVTTHLRRFQVDGDRAWVQAARAQQQADEARRRAAASVREELTRGGAAASRHERLIAQSGRASRIAAGDYGRLTGAVNSLTAAQMRAAAREGQLMERAAVQRRAALAQERTILRQREALANRQAAMAARQATSAAAPVSRTRPASSGFGIGVGPGLLAGGIAGYGGYKILSQANEFQAATRDAAAFAQLNARQQAELGKISRKAGLDTAEGATAAARAAGELAKADISLQKIGGGTLKATLNLARAGDVAHDEAAVSIARAMGVFDLGANKAEHVADVLVGASNTTAAGVQDFIMAFQAGASNAKAIGQSFDETVLSMVLQAKRGVQNSDAGTSLKTSLIQLARNPTKRQQEVLKDRNLNFFTKSGSLRSIGDISEMLRNRYKDASPKERTAELSALVGTDGVRTLLAWSSFSAEQVAQIKATLTKRGQAAAAAQKRTTEFAGAQRRLSAAGEETSIRVGTPMLNGLASVAESAVQVLQTPSVRRALDQFGEDMGERGKKLAEGFSSAAEDGRLKDALDSTLAAASAVGDAAEAAGSAVSKIAAAWASVPGPIRESVVQSLVFAAILKKMMGAAPAGLFAMGGARGSAAAAGSTTLIGGVGGGAAAASARIGAREALARRSELAAQQASTRAAAQAASQRLAAAQVAGASAFGAMGRGQSMAQIAAAERQAAAATRAANLAQRERAAFTRNMVRQTLPSGRSVGTAAAVGAGALALSGGDLKTALPTAAIVGAGLAGPWGAAGAVVATAAGAGLVKFFREKGKQELREALSDVRDGPGKDLSKQSQDLLAKLKRDADKRAAENMVGDGRGGLVARTSPSAAYLKAQREYGAAAGEAQVKETVKGRSVSPSFAIKSFIDANNKLTPEAKAAAAKPWLAAIAESEAKGKVLKGTTARFARSVGVELPQAMREAMTATATALRSDKRMEQAAGAARRNLEKALRGQEGAGGFQGLTKATEVGWRGIVSTTRTRIAELKAISEDYGGSTAETRAKASAEYHQLQRNLTKYLGDSKPAFTSLGRVGRFELAALADAAKKTGEEIGTVGKTLAETVAESMRQLERVTGPAPGDPDFVGPVQTKRHGGLVKRYRDGGWVPGLVSSGEEILDASGRSLGIVPGERVAADNVAMMLPAGGHVLTDDMQARRAMGQSLAQAVAHGLPHFASGGPIGPARAAQAYRTAGFNGTPLVRMTAIAGAESRWDPGAVSPPNNDTWRSKDHGLSQINDHWHPSYFKQPGKIYEPVFNARAAWAISNHGTNFGPWSTWGSGAWRAHESAARSGAAKSRGGGGEFNSVESTVPIVLGRSKTGRGELVPGSFGSGLQLGMSGYSGSDLRRFGNPALAGIASALGSGRYTRTVTSKGGGSDGSDGATSPGSGGTSTFNGKRVASWMVPALTYATKHGWSGVISSGFRSRAEQERLYANRGNNRYPVAKPGTSNHEGSVYPRGAIDTPDHQGLRRALAGYKGARKPKWYGPGDAVHFSGDGHRRGGRIRAYAGGGKIGPIGGVSVASGIQSGGANYYERLALAADEAAYGRVEKTIARLRSLVDAGGDARVVARARASMSVLENALGLRVGRMIGAASAALDARSFNQQATAAIQRIQGIDPGSAIGMSGQRLVEQRFLNDAPNREKELADAVKRAERGDLRSKAGRENLDAAKDALKQFRLQVLEAKGNVKDFDRAIAAAARAEVEASLERKVGMAAFTARRDDDVAAKLAQGNDFQGAAWAAALRGDTAGREDYDIKAAQVRADAEQLALEQRREDRRVGVDVAQKDLALAALTADPADNLAANKKLEEIFAAGLKSAIDAGDTLDITELATSLAGIKDAIDTLGADSKARDDARQDIAERRARAEEDMARYLVGLEPGEAMLAVIDQRLAAASNRLQGSTSRWMR